MTVRTHRDEDAATTSDCGGADSVPGRDADESLRLSLAAASVLVVDDEPGMRHFLARLLSERCALLETAPSAAAGEALRLRLHFDLLIVDIRLPGLSGIDWVSHLRRHGVRTRVVFMTAYADLSMAVEALRHGADDFVMKPFRADAILKALHRALARRGAEPVGTRRRLDAGRTHVEFGLVARSAAMRAFMDRLERIAPSDSPVLVTGETGSGKGLMARALHRLSGRRGAFVEVDCATLDDDELEPVLFGREATGVVERRAGLVSRAAGGTLLLDEISALSRHGQSRLLSLLDPGAIRPVGADDVRRVDVRIVAATHEDLAVATADGRFRVDLYRRLIALTASVPPLRVRGDDLDPLAEGLMLECAANLRRDEVALLHDERRRLHAWTWPGNVRELRQTMEQTLLFGRLPPEACGGSEPVDTIGVGYPVDWPLERVERAHMEAVLQANGQNKSAAARQLGVSRKTLERKLAAWREGG